MIKIYLKEDIPFPPNDKRVCDMLTETGCDFRDFYYDYSNYPIIIVSSENDKISINGFNPRYNDLIVGMVIQ